MYQQHQLRQRPQGGKTEVRHRYGNQREYPNRRITHHHMGDFEHGFRDGAEHGHQRLAMGGGQRRQAQTKQHREEDDRQHFALRHRRHDIGRHQRQDRAHQAMRMALHFCGCALVFRNIHRRQLRHINTRARLEHIRQRDAKNDRDRSDHFEIKNRFCADTAELLRVADPGNPNHQRRNDNWHHNHLDQMNKDITGWRQ